MLKIIQLTGVWHEIFDFWFFHVSVSLGSLSIPLTKIRVDIHNFVFVAGIIDIDSWKNLKSKISC